MNFLAKYPTTSICALVLVGIMFSLPQFGTSPLGISYFSLAAAFLAFIGFLPIAHRSALAAGFAQNGAVPLAIMMAFVISAGAIASSVVATRYL